MYLNFPVPLALLTTPNVEPRHKMYLNTPIFSYLLFLLPVEPRHKMYLNWNEIDVINKAF